MSTLSAEERRKKIREFVELHEGFSPEQCFKALEPEMARSTFFGHLLELKSDGIITTQHANKRDQKLFLNESNILVSSQKKLEKFDYAYSRLLKETEQKILSDSYVTRLLSGQSEVHSPEQIGQLTHARLDIFFRMIDSILLQSLIVWPKKIEDKDTLKKVYVSVLLKIGDMVSRYSEMYDLWEIAQRLEIFKRLHGASALLEFQEIYENVGMKQEIDAVIDSLWDIDKQIIPLAYKEKEYWDLDWKESEGWRKLLALVKGRNRG